MTRVKVCGLMNKTDIKICLQAGVHALGFVVEYPVPVPWNLSVEEAKKLMHPLPPFVSTSVVVGGSVEKIVKIAEETQPDIVQLHYKETIPEIKELIRELSLNGIKVIKALRLDEEGHFNFEIKDPVKAVKELEKIGLSAVLVDSYTDSRPGGTGIQIDLSTFKLIQKQTSLPVILAGGLNPDNVSSIVKTTQPFAVDVLTGVENEPNNKDADQIKKFMKAASS